MHAGKPSYDPSANDYLSATIGRVTRYTARASDGRRTVDPASRKVLVGETISTGIPILRGSHGPGNLLFGTDGTLLVAVGDAASWEGVDDGGSDGNSTAPRGLIDGIIRPNEEVGAFRSQLVDSLSGKILRLDPATGNAVASNPFFDPQNPRAAKSRVWTLGLRNPYRMTLRPGTGAIFLPMRIPGVIVLGDVGWEDWEEVHVIDGPGQNCGWPLFSGAAGGPDLQRINHGEPYRAESCRRIFPFQGSARAGDARHSVLAKSAHPSAADSRKYSALHAQPAGVGCWPRCDTPRPGAHDRCRRSRLPGGGAAVSREYQHGWRFLSEFGDGTESNAANPTHTFTSATAKRFDVRLTVTDAAGASASATVAVFANHALPQVELLSPVHGTRYPLTSSTDYRLTRRITDVTGHPTTTRWNVYLVHHEHEHAEPAITGDEAVVTLSPV